MISCDYLILQPSEPNLNCIFISDTHDGLLYDGHLETQELQEQANITGSSGFPGIKLHVNGSHYF